MVKRPVPYMSVVKLKPNGKATFPFHTYHKGSFVLLDFM